MLQIFDRLFKSLRSVKRSRALISSVVLGSGTIAITYASSHEFLVPQSYPFPDKKLMGETDHASLRRGFQVFRQVCSACHSMKSFSFRHLVGVTHTQEEASKIAANYMIDDGPDEDGNYFKRKGKLVDFWPSPYKNNEEAKKMNNGAVPPDLSVLALGREGNKDYIFSLLTGYLGDPPAGCKISEGTYFNVYMNHYVIGMAPPLYDEAIEFEDGTVASVSQMAKDVSAFLSWVADPYKNEKKQMALYSFLILIPLTICSFYYHRKAKNVLELEKNIFRKMGSKEK